MKSNMQSSNAVDLPPQQPRDYCPVAYIVDWKFVLSEALVDFFDLYNDCFKRDDATGKYILSETLTKYKFSKIFNVLTDNILQRLAGQITKERTHVKRIYVVNTCKLNDNVSTVYFWEKEKQQALNVSYTFAETDISFDIVKFEDATGKNFNKYFTKSKTADGFVFVKHKNFSSKFISKIIRKYYGPGHSINCGSAKRNLLQKYFPKLVSADGSPRNILRDLNDEAALDKKHVSLNSMAVDCKIKELKQFLGFSS